MTWSTLLCLLLISSYLQSFKVKVINMGKALSRLFGNKEMRILMLGLDAAGKTSILLQKFCVLVKKDSLAKT